VLVLGMSPAEAFGCLCPERIAAHRVSPCSASSRALYAAIHKLAAHAISCSTGVNKRPRMSPYWGE
jgi:hypothetical protein